MTNSDIVSVLSSAVSAHSAGRLDAAAAGYRQVLARQKDHFDALNLLGLVEHAQARWPEALAFFDRALKAQPGQAGAHYNRANTLMEMGRLEEAAAGYRKAVDLQPVYPDAWLNLGAVLHRAGDLAGATAAFEELVRLSPADARGHYNLGRILAERSEAVRAEAALRRALELAPSSADARLTLAKLFADTQRLRDAVSEAKRVIAAHPRNVTAWTNLAAYLSYDDDLSGAEDAYNTALGLEPGSATIKANLALVQFAQGDLTNAWENFVTRAQSAGPYIYRKLNVPWPTWNGEPLAGKSIFIWGEQGLGDEILFAGMLPDIAAAAANCTFGCTARLVKLFQRSFPTVEVLPLEDVLAARGERRFDYQSSLIDLGRWRRASLSAFPNRAGYLKADPSRVAQMRAYGPATFPRIGLSWRSFAAHVGEQKTPPLAVWRSLARLENKTLISLQYGPIQAVARERVELADMLDCDVHHDPEMDLTADIDTIAALIQTLDVVVTVSNTTAHLAGSLGIPTLVLAPSGKARLWYWFEAGRASPWYPTVRVARWRIGETALLEHVIAAVMDSLKQA